MTATGAGAENGLVQVRRLDPPIPTDAGTATGDAVLTPADIAGIRPPADAALARPTAFVVRAVAALVGCVASGIVAILLVRQGVRTDEFPPFLDGTAQTPITRYSGPWITAGAGAVLVATLCLLFAVVNAVRWSQSRSADTTT